LNPVLIKTSKIRISLLTRKYFFSLYLLVFSGFIMYAGNEPVKIKPLQFEIYYETLQPLRLINATLYISPDKLLGHTDSVKMKLSADNTFQDTLYLDFPWQFPVHARIKLNFSDRVQISNKFYLDPQHEKWQISISDTAALIKAKPKFSFEEKDSYMGMILLIQMFLELILAALIVRFFRWPAWVILVILVSNLAAYPIFLLKLNPSYLGDLLALFIKFLVIFLTGRRRLGIVRIIILVVTLPLISYGIKEILILIFKLI
jgi:hypothetical protein